jgi:hypothetical protein
MGVQYASGWPVAAKGCSSTYDQWKKFGGSRVGWRTMQRAVSCQVAAF